MSLGDAFFRRGNGRYVSSIHNVVNYAQHKGVLPNAKGRIDVVKARV